MTITQEELKKSLRYDPETGVFRWAVNRGRLLSGNVAGYVSISNMKQYIKIRINYKNYYGHRLAWLYMTGEWPENEIDHIDGNGTKNEWVNLRSVNRADNMKNSRRQSNNTSGFCGIWWHRKNRKWVSEIMVNQKKINIGSFDNIFDAVCSRKNAEFKHGFHKNHGSDRPL